MKTLNSLFCRTFFMLLCLCGVMRAAQAQTYTCSAVAPSAMSLTYDATATGQGTLTGSVTITCSRTGTGNTTRFYEIGAALSANASGSQRRAKTGSVFINYNLWRNSGFSQKWANTAGPPSADRLATSIAFSTANRTNVQVTVPFYMTVPALQASAIGTYTDTVTVNVYQGTAANTITTAVAVTNSFVVTVTVSPACKLSSSPGAINFTYVSYQTSPSTPSTSFAVYCATNTSYTMALDATSGSIKSLNYTLALTPTGTQTGNATAQSATISGTMAANQVGSCVGGCTGTVARTLTVSY